MDLKNATLIANALAVPTGDSSTAVWSNSFKMGHSKAFTAMAICASAQTPNVKVQLEVSYRMLTVGGLTNLNEGATSIYYVVPDVFPDIFSNILDTNYHAKGYQPPYAVYGRYKIIGQTGNPSDTTITIYNMVQELGRSYGD